MNRAERCTGRRVASTACLLLLACTCAVATSVGGQQSEPEQSWWLSSAGLSLELLRGAVLGREGQSTLKWGRVEYTGHKNASSSAADACASLHLGDLFKVVLRKGRARHLPSSNCTVAEGVPINATESALQAQLLCPESLQVWLNISLAPVYIASRKPKNSSSSSGAGPAAAAAAGAAARMEVRLSGPNKAAPHSLTLLTLNNNSNCTLPPVEATGKVDGSPVIAQGRYFLSLEHPLAKQKVLDPTLPKGRALELSVTHLHARAWKSSRKTNASASNESSTLKEGGAVLTTFRYTASIGVTADTSQLRRVFLAYLMQSRLPSAWKGPLVHYNSWYDFTSWQDEGFFSAKRARNVKELQTLQTLLAELRTDQMTESAATSVVRTYGEELVKKRNVSLHSFLWDDGWDNPETDLWSFDKTRFPRGFEPVAKVAEEYGCGNGVWLSPWGGYGGGKDRRLEIAKKEGFETNSQGLSLAGPKYFQRFKDAATFFRREQGVNFFKIDGVAGDPSELAAEIEAMLGISAELHVTADGEIWINLTTGTWPSPFFLLWVDSIWRGHTDTLLMNTSVLPDATNRQRWHAFRECIVYLFVVERAKFFPLSRLMIHGVVLAQHGDARANTLNQASDVDWELEVWSFASMGLLLQELYISPELMTSKRWDVLAEGLKWMEQNWQLLDDMRWVFPAHCSDGTWKPHGWAAWQDGEGYITIRNMRLFTVGETPWFTLQEALELPQTELEESSLQSSSSKKKPSASSGQQLMVRVFRRIEPGSRNKVANTGMCSFLEKSVEGQIPSSSAAAAAGSLSQTQARACFLRANQRTRVHMGGGELLMLHVLEVGSASASAHVPQAAALPRGVEL